MLLRVHTGTNDQAQHRTVSVQNSVYTRQSENLRRVRPVDCKRRGLSTRKIMVHSNELKTPTNGEINRRDGLVGGVQRTNDMEIVEILIGLLKNVIW